MTLEHVVEELRLLLKREKVPEDLPAEAGPAKYPYTNNSVADFSDMVSPQVSRGMHPGGIAYFWTCSLPWVFVFFIYLHVFSRA